MLISQNAPLYPFTQPSENLKKTLTEFLSVRDSTALSSSCRRFRIIFPVNYPPLARLPKVLMEGSITDFLTEYDYVSLSLSCRFFKRLFDLSSTVWRKKMVYPSTSALHYIWSIPKKNPLPPMIDYALYVAFKDPKTLRPLRLERPVEKGHVAAMDASGSLVAFGGDKRTIRVLEKEGVSLLKEDSMEPITNIAINASGSLIVASTYKTVDIWERAAKGRWKKTFTFEDSISSILSVASNSLGSLVVAASESAVYILKKRQQKTWKQTFVLKGTGLFKVVTNASGSLIVTGSLNENCTIWEKTGKTWTPTPLFSALTVAVNASGSLIFTGVKNGDINVWEKNKTWKRAHALTDFRSPVCSLVTNDSGSLICAGTIKGTANIWRKEKGTWKLFLSFTNHQAQPIRTLAANSSGSRIAIVSQGNISLWAPNPALSNRLTLLKLQRTGKPLASFYDLEVGTVKNILPYLTPKEIFRFLVNKGMVRCFFPLLQTRVTEKLKAKKQWTTRMKAQAQRMKAGVKTGVKNGLNTLTSVLNKF